MFFFVVKILNYSIRNLLMAKGTLNLARTFSIPTENLDFFLIS